MLQCAHRVRFPFAGELGRCSTYSFVTVLSIVAISRRTCSRSPPAVFEEGVVQTSTLLVRQFAENPRSSNNRWVRLTTADSP